MRYDRALLASRDGHHRALSIELLGTSPAIDAGEIVFPSDHFGLVVDIASDAKHGSKPRERSARCGSTACSSSSRRQSRGTLRWAPALFTVTRALCARAVRVDIAAWL